jgi:hypothetical protein
MDKYNEALSPTYSLVVTRNLRLIFNMIVFLNLVKHIFKKLQNSKDSKYVVIFSLASVVTELLAIL